MVFLTGATGYVGRALLAHLTATGVRVRCLVAPDDPVEPEAGPLVEVVRGDVTKADGLAAAGGGVEAVVHSAAVMPPAPRERIHHVNVEGTRLMVGLATRWGVRRFVYLSAVSATYAVPTAYGVAKLRAEELVRESGLPHTILRPTMVYGPGGGLHFQKLVALVRGAPIVLPVIGPGTQRLQPVGVDDVVQAIELARLHPDAVGKTYAVSGETVLTFDELVERIAAALGRRRVKLHLPLAACVRIARVLERMNPESFLTTDAVAGVTQDASLDWSDFRRDCGYQPAPLTTGLERAVGAPAGTPRRG